MSDGEVSAGQIEFEMEEATLRAVGIGAVAVEIMLNREEFVERGFNPTEAGTFYLTGTLSWDGFALPPVEDEPTPLGR